MTAARARDAASMVQDLIPTGAGPLRADAQGPRIVPGAPLDHDLSPQPRFRIQRESEVPQLLASMEAEGLLSSSAVRRTDGQRPDELASAQQERRQVIAVARVVCQATAETLLGLRSVSQLRRWLDREVYNKVQQRVAVMARHREGATVRPRPLSFRSERACQPVPGTWEVSVVFSDEMRTRACAMRLEAHRGRWRVVAMELG